MANLTATERRDSLLASAAHGPAYSLKALIATVVPGAVASGTTITFGRIPSNARISGLSKVYSDDLSTTGSPTLDIGLKAVNGNLANADDPDALSNGHAISSAVAASAVIGDIANVGLPAWDFVASETSDPGGELEVYGSIVDAATAGITTGDLTVEIYYYVD